MSYRFTSSHGFRWRALINRSITHAQINKKSKQVLIMFGLGSKKVSGSIEPVVRTALQNQSISYDAYAEAERIANEGNNPENVRLFANLKDAYNSGLVDVTMPQRSRR
jgi:hypothetical protein